LSKAYLLYFLLLVATAFYLPPAFFNADTRSFILLLGAVATWRYGWMLLNFVRSLIYRKRVFPRLRQQATTMGDEALPDHVFLILTTFRVGTEVSIRVYREAIREAINCGVPTTLIASIVEMSEQNLVKALFNDQNPPAHVKLKIVRIDGTGKRDALAVAFRAVSNTPVNLQRSVAAVIDGDSILSPGSVAACFRLFALDSKLGALTTDEVCQLDGTDRITGVYRRWYNMRFAQRHMYMSSNGLSKRVLTLTGRMSMFRASIVAQAGFVHTVQHDYIDHWRFGRFQFLTGDDKSSWFHVLKGGWEIWYVPDVKILTIEEPPHPNFFIGANMLMRRWFGNALRANVRARKVPRKNIGLFTWWSILDQRVAMWPPLFGFFIGIFASLLHGIMAIFFFIWWICLLRFLQVLLLRSVRKEVSISWPFFLYFNQIYGSLVKIYMLYHLTKQKWTRQKTTLKAGESRWANRYQDASSKVLMTAALLIFITGIAFIVGALDMGDVYHAIDTIY